MSGCCSPLSSLFKLFKKRSDKAQRAASARRLLAKDQPDCEQDSVSAGHQHLATPKQQVQAHRQAVSSAVEQQLHTVARSAQAHDDRIFKLQTDSDNRLVVNEQQQLDQSPKEQASARTAADVQLQQAREAELIKLKSELDSALVVATQHHKQHVATLQQQHEQSISQKEAELNAAVELVESDRVQQQERLAALQHSHHAASQAQEQTHSLAVYSLQEDHENAVGRMQSLLESVDQQRAHGDMAMKFMQQQHQVALSQQQADHDQAVSFLQQQNIELEQHTSQQQHHFEKQQLLNAAALALAEHQSAERLQQTKRELEQQQCDHAHKVSLVQQQVVELKQQQAAAKQHTQQLAEAKREVEGEMQQLKTSTADEIETEKHKLGAEYAQRFLEAAANSEADLQWLRLTLEAEKQSTLDQMAVAHAEEIASAQASVLQQLQQSSLSFAVEHESSLAAAATEQAEMLRVAKEEAAAWKQQYAEWMLKCENQMDKYLVLPKKAEEGSGAINSQAPEKERLQLDSDKVEQLPDKVEQSELPEAEAVSQSMLSLSSSSPKNIADLGPTTDLCKTGLARNTAMEQVPWRFTGVAIAKQAAELHLVPEWRRHTQTQNSWGEGITPAITEEVELTLGKTEESPNKAQGSTDKAIVTVDHVESHNADNNVGKDSIVAAVQKVPWVKKDGDTDHVGSDEATAAEAGQVPSKTITKAAHRATEEDHSPTSANDRQADMAQHNDRTIKAHRAPLLDSNLAVAKSPSADSCFGFEQSMTTPHLNPAQHTMPDNMAEETHRPNMAETSNPAAGEATPPRRVSVDPAQATAARVLSSGKIVGDGFGSADNLYHSPPAKTDGSVNARSREDVLADVSDEWAPSWAFVHKGRSRGPLSLAKLAFFWHKDQLTADDVVHHVSQTKDQGLTVAELVNAWMDCNKGRGLLSPCCWETNRAGKIHLQYPLLPQEKEPGL